MRVLHVYHDFAPARGGIEDYLADLTRAQAAAGLEPVVLTSRPRPVTRVESIAGVRVIRAASFGRYFTPLCPSWPAWVRRVQPDIVHLHLPCPLGEWVLALAPPRRLVVSLHNDYVRPRLALALHRPLHRAILRRAAAIIVAAPDYAQSSPVLGDLQDKVCIVPYGIDLVRYTPAEHFAEGHAPILFAGRLCYYKGAEVLLDAAPAMDGGVELIGDGPWRDRLLAQAQCNRLGARVAFRGAVDEESLITQMRASRVFAFPSTERSEAFGIAQLKAMACGLPVVSTDLPGVRWLNRHGETGLTVPVRDAGALALAVNRLLADDDLRARLSDGALARARELPLSRMVDATAAVYRSLS